MNETNWWDKEPYVKQVRLGEFTIMRDPKNGEHFKSVPIYDIPAIIQAVREEERLNHKCNCPCGTVAPPPNGN